MGITDQREKRLNKRANTHLFSPPVNSKLLRCPVTLVNTICEFPFLPTLQLKSQLQLYTDNPFRCVYVFSTNVSAETVEYINSITYNTFSKWHITWWKACPKSASFYYNTTSLVFFVIYTYLTQTHAHSMKSRTYTKLTSTLIMIVVEMW